MGLDICGDSSLLSRQMGEAHNNSIAGHNLELFEHSGDITCFRKDRWQSCWHDHTYTVLAARICGDALIYLAPWRRVGDLVVVHGCLAWSHFTPRQPSWSQNVMQLTPKKMTSFEHQHIQPSTRKVSRRCQAIVPTSNHDDIVLRLGDGRRSCGWSTSKWWASEILRHFIQPASEHDLLRIDAEYATAIDRRRTTSIQAPDESNANSLDQVVHELSDGLDACSRLLSWQQ
jgi:hypothetical protein